MSVSRHRQLICHGGRRRKQWQACTKILVAVVFCLCSIHLFSYVAHPSQLSCSWFLFFLLPLHPEVLRLVFVEEDVQCVQMHFEVQWQEERMMVLQWVKGAVVVLLRPRDEAPE